MFVKKMKINPQKIFPKIPAAKEDHIKAKVNEIKKNVEETIIPEPETSRPSDNLISTWYPKAKQQRPPHCKTCGHPVKGHHTKQKTKIGRIFPAN